ncbi:MAG: hypothetical protein NTX98_00560 [Candidatus Doudnabacteria bacterium]|nr:hypothetical protein [Candidatus Doudnabacteria bacterium]
MIHKIPITKARVHLGKIVKAVFLRKDVYILEKNGIPMAKIVYPDKKKK